MAGGGGLYYTPIVTMFGPEDDTFVAKHVTQFINVVNKCAL
jgi:hypothetical protein